MDCNTLAGGQCPTRFHLAGHMSEKPDNTKMPYYEKPAPSTAENEKSESTVVLENAAWARMYGIRAGWLWVEGRRTTLRALLEAFPEREKYDAVRLWEDDTVRPIMEKAFQRVKSNVVE